MNAADKCQYRNVVIFTAEMAGVDGKSVALIFQVGNGKTAQQRSGQCYKLLQLLILRQQVGNGFVAGSDYSWPK